MAAKQSISILKTENEYFLRHPSEQTFYKILAPLMGILCLNTQYWTWYFLPKNKLFRVQRILVPTFVPVACASQITYLCLNFREHEFNVIAVILSIVPVAMAVLFKIISAQRSSYKRAFEDFMDKIHLYNYYSKNYTDEKHNFIKHTLINAEKYTRNSFYILTTAVFICYSSWMMVPIVHNVQNNHSIRNITTRLELTIYLWQPFDYEFNFYGYIFLQILGMYCGAIAILVMVPFDTVNLAFIYHLIGHINIFKYDLKVGQKLKLNDAEWKEKLTNITLTYHFITQTFKDVEAAYGFNVTTIYAQNLFQGGLLLYQIMTAGKDTGVLLTFGLMIPIFMGLLMLISIVLENVRIQADDIPSLVYDLPWESMSISNQKILQSILCQVQPTLEFTAAFNIKTGVQPALNIIKTTFSYYVMIKSRKEM